MKEKVLKALWWAWMLLPLVFITFFVGVGISSGIWFSGIVQLFIVWAGTLALFYWVYRSWFHTSRLYALHLASWVQIGYWVLNVELGKAGMVSVLQTCFPEYTYAWLCFLLPWVLFVLVVLLFHTAAYQLVSGSRR